MKKISKTLAALITCLAAILILPFQVSAFYTNMPANLVIGQADFTHGSINQGNGANASANTMRFPRRTIYDPVTGKLFIPDANNHRILIYNRIPTSNNVSADVVIGQTNLTNATANQGGSAAANTLNQPVDVYFDPRSRKLFVCDQLNNRVLIYNQIPTSNNASADVVIGQQSFSGSSVNQGGSATASTLNIMRNVVVDQETGKLIISDFGNSRVLIYNQIPTTNNTSADVVIGQQNFTTSSVNQGGSVNANTMNFPSHVFVDSSSRKLFVVEQGNSRILIFNQIPTTNNASADNVIGQADFTHNSANQGGSVGPNTLSATANAYVDQASGKLFVGDQANNRVLIYDNVPTSNNAFANQVIGQADFTHNSTNQGGSTDANTLNTPVNVTTIPETGQMLVSDTSNSRILIYNNDRTAPGLSVGAPQSAENNLIKLTGNASTINHYTIQNVQYMVNGGGFNGATATDGAFDSANENFFFTFDPKSNNNTNDGYTVQLRSTTTNKDTTDHLFYFQPFNLNTPMDRSFVSKALPTFSFSVNKQQTQLKENLLKYTLMVKNSGGDWRIYVDNIPVDYASVKDSVDNLQKSSNSDNGNGNYEDKKILVTYSNNNSTISLTPKAVDDQGNAISLSFDQNGKLLNNGGYEWKVQAIDKNGHVQETETRKFVVGSSQFSNGSSWFPLQINSISGLGRVYLSTIAPQLIKPKYRIQMPNPTFKGIATANSVVQLDLTNQTCLTKGEGNCIQTFSANSNGASQFTLSTSTNTLKTGNIYQAQFSVSQNGLFNALPPFQITR